MSLDAEMSREYGRRALKRVSFNTVTEHPDKSVLKRISRCRVISRLIFMCRVLSFRMSAMMAGHTFFVAISNSYPLHTPRVDYSVLHTVFFFG